MPNTLFQGGEHFSKAAKAPLEMATFIDHGPEYTVLANACVKLTQ